MDMEQKPPPTTEPMKVEEEVIEDEMVTAYDEIEDSVEVADFIAILKNARIDDAANKIKEKCILKMTRIYTEAKKIDDVLNILKSNNDYFSIIPKARTAKLVRNIIAIVATVPDSLPIQIQLCKDVIEWCKAEKRTFLRQRIEAKLASLLLQSGDPTQALNLLNSLLHELKKLDDKQMLTEVFLTESRVHHALQNFPKAKAALTASRTAANVIYVSPLLQAEIDEMSGVLHCEEGDHVTAYSYFLESFEGYDGGNDRRAVTCLKYMMLAKVLSESASEVPSILGTKQAMKYSGVELDAMSAIAKAAKLRSLEDFTATVQQYEMQLRHDTLISHQLDDLFQKMMELNLLKIVLPYSCVEIAHVASLIKLPEPEVERKLSQMILDRRFAGILDQGKGHLIIYENSSEDKAFTKGLSVIANIGTVVEALANHAKLVEKTPV